MTTKLIYLRELICGSITFNLVKARGGAIRGSKALSTETASAPYILHCMHPIDGTEREYHSTPDHH